MDIGNGIAEQTISPGDIVSWSCLLHLCGTDALQYAIDNGLDYVQYKDGELEFPVVAHSTFVRSLARTQPNCIRAGQHVVGAFLVREILFPGETSPAALGRAVYSGESYEEARNAMGEFLTGGDLHPWGLAIQDLENQIIDWGDALIPFESAGGNHASKA